jgi:hypothetical protein
MMMSKNPARIERKTSRGMKEQICISGTSTKKVILVRSISCCCDLSLLPFAVKRYVSELAVDDAALCLDLLESSMWVKRCKHNPFGWRLTTHG